MLTFIEEKKISLQTAQCLLAHSKGPTASRNISPNPSDQPWHIFLMGSMVCSCHSSRGGWCFIPLTWQVGPPSENMPMLLAAQANDIFESIHINNTSRSGGQGIIMDWHVHPFWLFSYSTTTTLSHSLYKLCLSPLETVGQSKQQNYSLLCSKQYLPKTSRSSCTTIVSLNTATVSHEEEPGLWTPFNVPDRQHGQKLQIDTMYNIE